MSHKFASTLHFLARPITVLWLLLVLFKCSIEKNREGSLDRADVPQLQAKAAQIYKKGEPFTKTRKEYEEARILYGQIYEITSDIDSYVSYCELTWRLEPVLARSCFDKISNYYLRKSSSWWRSPLTSGSDRRQDLILSDLYRQKSSKANSLIVRCQRRHIKLVKCNRDNIR